MGFIATYYKPSLYVIVISKCVASYVAMYDELSVHIESEIETLMCFKSQLKIILISNQLLQMSFGKLISSCMLLWS